MEIHFGINYTNNAFVDFKAHKQIFMDHSVVGLEGLLDILELHLGIYNEAMSTTDRQATYYAAFRKTMAKGRNVFTSSWEKNGLGVSNECLKWRDTLRMSGWKADMQQASERLSVLADVEKTFNAPALGDRLEQIIPLLQNNPLPVGSKIYVAANDESGISPMVVDLLNKLQEGGTQIEYEDDVVIAPKGSNLSRIQHLLIYNESEDCLKTDDDTFKIWNFDTELDAARYIASQSKDDYNVYITADGKLLDNVQRMLHQPTSGSSITNAHPQIAQLFKLGLSLFEYPFNIRNLVSWLQMPVHPIKSELRRNLVKTILSTGGYKNEAYDNVIANYRDTLETQKEKDVIDSCLEIFIPTPEAKGVNKDRLLRFVNSLNAWCGMMTNIEDMSEANLIQLAKVAGLCKSLLSIAEEEQEEYIQYRKLESWISTLYTGTDFAIYGCQAGARWTVAANDMAEKADRILWTDCYNGSIAIPSTDFLNEHEKMMLEKEGCKFWNNADFNKAMMRTLLRPVLKCGKQLVLVVTNNSKGTTTAKHPLIIRLENAFEKSLLNVCIHPDNAKAENKKVMMVDNHSEEDEVVIENKNILHMPSTESYTSLDNLIQYPLDYVMDRILELRDRSSTEMDDISTVKGIVAHAVIEQLFKGSREDIARNINDKFTSTLEHITMEQGAILLLQENSIELQLFTVQLKECLEALLEIIRNNTLTVINCEYRVSKIIGMMEDKDIDPTVNGFVDMTLKNDNDEIFVFDFKWTSSRSWHKKLLEKNISVQLALYEHLVALETEQKVVATAYFTMPQHKLYTTSNRIKEGANVEHITPENNDDLLLKIKNSYKFRREQIQNGIIENAEGIEMQNIPYAMQQKELNLVPLSPDYNDESIHAANGFSNYSCFKNN